MARFTLAGDPRLSGSSLSWSAVLDPGTMEMAAAGSSVDTVDCWRMTSNDPTGNDAQSELTLQCEMRLRDDVLPGDGYTESVDLDLRDGYYHVVLTIDSDDAGAGVYELHVRVEDGAYELKSWHQTM